MLEKLARGEKRALLTLATGAGKTFIAVNLLRRIADAGQLRRALFVCDRDELRNQASGAFHAVFGTDAAPVAKGRPEKNARVLIATYQTLDVDVARYLFPFESSLGQTVKIGADYYTVIGTVLSRVRQKSDAASGGLQ